MKLIKPNLSKLSPDEKIKYIKQLEAALKDRDKVLSARQEDYNRMNMRFNLLKELLPVVENGDADHIIEEAEKLVDWCRKPYEEHLSNENGND